MRFRSSKIKNWKRIELRELSILLNFLSNAEICEYYGIPLSHLNNSMIKYNLSRPVEITSLNRSNRMAGDNNPNWKDGISRNTARYLSIQRERYPNHKKARDAVYRALKKGILVKPDRCSECGKVTTDIQGHHNSYDEDKWLDVEWLCRRCHRKRENGKH